MSNATNSQPWQGSKGRVEAFSDGVFAIAVTLLVLDLRSPEVPGEFAHDLAVQWPSYLAYVAAFAMVGSVWLHHHLVFARVARVDIGVILTNLVLLLTVSILPFPTAVLSSAWRLGERSDRVVAAVLFALLSVAISGAYIGLCTYLAGHVGMLGDVGERAFLRGERRRGAIAILGTVVAALLAFVSPLLALVLFAITPVFYLTTLPLTAVGDPEAEVPPPTA